MKINKNYNPREIEDKWYQLWTKHQVFESVPDDRESYTIVIPPPNVTGVLHMGHVLNNSIQDILIRKKRMEGKNCLWLPGTDHASIATEAKVVEKLKEEGIHKKDLSREEFLEHAHAWREKHGGIILEQLKKLGASCDWTRTKFTMDEDMSGSVIKTFVDLYNKGLIYRGVRMVNWDPSAQTALSDEEVVYQEEDSKLYYVKYFLENANDYIPIATTRPETILGDTALCVNPKDPRYQEFIGKKVIVPMVNRIIPVISDDYVDMEFGTGALKITPAHDINDYAIGERHRLPSIDIFNDNGTLHANAVLFVGTDRFEARKLAVEKLKKDELLIREENYKNKLGYSERTHVVIEPKLSTQWFLKMQYLAQPALQAVMNNEVQFHPDKFKNTYRHWMENIKDWCISRQLWWGHRIPAWYLPDASCIVAENESAALEKARELSQNPDLQPDALKQDEDVLDTWFSSWLWPISVFDGIRYPDNPDIRYYYPTQDLVTAPEIIFFWVARMIMAGYAFRDKKPFENVYFTGIVRDQRRRKMSKSLGNSPDPLLLIDKYGADGVRLGMMLSSPAGNDLLFDENLCEQGRNFNNKIWNAYRLISSWKVEEKTQAPANKTALQYFRNKCNQATDIIHDHFSKYRISDALMTAYKLFRDDFSSWFLEIIKPPYGENTDQETHQECIFFFEKMMQLLHPFIPFITEEMWHLIQKREEDDFIGLRNWPETEKYDEAFLDHFENTKKIITALRDFRVSHKIPNKKKIRLLIPDNKEHFSTFDAIIIKLGQLENISYIDEKPARCFSFITGSTEYFIEIDQQEASEDEILEIQKELDYQKGFLESVLKKLNNEKFLKNAAEKIIQLEKKKMNDAEKRIEILNDKLRSLGSE
jgi:valyl-tRNA synthetase